MTFPNDPDEASPPSPAAPRSQSPVHRPWSSHDSASPASLSRKPARIRLTRRYTAIENGHLKVLVPEVEVEEEGVEEDSQDAGLGKTLALAKKQGGKQIWSMSLGYYIPFFQWIWQYKWAYFRGDFIAALTMASFYIPMALSYAENLAHTSSINGLYSFVFTPFIYALLGTCPQLVVGPEAAGSLLVGSVIKTSIESKLSSDEDMLMHSRVTGVVTGMAGAVIFIAGLARLGFLENVLSRPFLRGFISAIGFVILVDQLLPELGLIERAKEAHVKHGSSVEKLAFLVTNLKYAHGLTCAVAFGSFAIIMVLRQVKRGLQIYYPSVAFVPDRFIVVVLSIIFSWRFCWDKKGLEILGEVRSSTGSAFPFHWPFIPAHMVHIREVMGTSFLIALLGFFESSVAAKSLSGRNSKPGEGLQDIHLNANRELVALGTANLVGGCFMALPAFGGYARSKVNASTGGRTPMSSILLSVITKAVLSAMISVVAYSLIEEAPEDIRFFFKIGGWSELFLMFLIFASTIFYSLALGIALGVGFSILSVIRHATKPRIQILGKVPGKKDQFENAENNAHHLEFVEGCLIIKIPEPLTFANTGDLKSRLKRLELYGAVGKHLNIRKSRPSTNNKNVIFDIHGVTALDGSGTQVLAEIVDSYVERGVRVFFCRGPRQGSLIFKMFEQSGIVERSGGRQNFVASVDEALMMTESGSSTEPYRDNPGDENV